MTGNTEREQRSEVSRRKYLRLIILEREKNKRDAEAKLVGLIHRGLVPRLRMSRHSLVNKVVTDMGNSEIIFFLVFKEW